MGFVAINQLDVTHAELKSMRTVAKARKLGIGSQMIEHRLAFAKHQRFNRISIETGVEEHFLAARKLYEKFGFECCSPFANYEADPNCKFMTLAI